MEPEITNHNSKIDNILQVYVEDYFVDHKWEELVAKMCCSDDPKLRKTGLEEYNLLKLKNPAYKLGNIDQCIFD
jgi:hypothetical protein